jgi:SAM-dependent methyltransferase
MNLRVENDCAPDVSSTRAGLGRVAKAAKRHEQVGWELIWRKGDDHPRYGSYADPDPAVVEWAKAIPAHGFVLDVGCGVGRHMVYLGACGFRMAGLDVSPSGIRLTEAACTNRHIAIEAHVSDMIDLHWADQTFDAALSISAIHHHRRDEIKRALGEVRRVLKPGGLLLVDFPCTETLDYRQLRSQVAAGHIAEIEPNTFVDERPDLDDMDDSFLPHHYCDEGDLRDLLRSFEIVRLWAALRQSKEGAGMRGKWIASARRPSSA